MSLLSPMFLRAGAAMLFVAAMLSACTVVVDEDDGGSRRPGQLCTRDYDPVCARRGGDRQTFANSCLADDAGYRVVRRGECGRDDGNGGGNGGGDRTCSRQYEPVCARRGGDRQTFSNSCLADQAGYRVIREGECRAENEGRPQPEEQICSRDYDPVCARGNGELRTFPNSCEADKSGYRIVSGGAC